MMLKAEDDDGYCSRSSLDSPIHIIKIETNSNSVLDFKEKESLKRKDMDHQSYIAPSFLEVMLTRDDWKKSDNQSATTSSTISGLKASIQISQNKSLAETPTCFSIERIPEKEFQPRKTIKLMPSSSQNLLLFTKQSALSGLVVSSKTNTCSNPVALHSLIKNNHNISLNCNNNNQNVHSQQPHRRIAPLPGSQPIKLTAAEILKSKISQQPNICETQKKLQTTKIITPLHKKINPGKDLNSQGSIDSFTSARTGQPYVRNSKGNVWTNRPTPYVGRHELHPVIDHDYCEFSAFNAEIQSGIILMSRETCARTDRMNMKRNKTPHQSPIVTSSLSDTLSLPTTSSVSSVRNGVVRNVDAKTFSAQQQSQVNQLPENKRKYLKRKFNGPPTDATSGMSVKNAVGRPRLAGKTEKNSTLGRKSNGYDSSDDLSSPPLTDDKNYVKIPGSFQNDFVYYATIRGRSSRKRQSEQSKQQSDAQSTAQQKNSVTNNMKAFEWYREMANTDKTVRFGSKDSTLNDLNRVTKDETKNPKLDVANIFSCPFDGGKNLISESEVAELVMQMLPTSEDDPLFLDPATSGSKLTSVDIMGSDMDGIIDIGSIDLNTMATEFGHMLGSEQKQESLHGQQDLHGMDFPTMSSSQLLEDICENDLLMSADIANMNAFLNDFPDDQVDICVESDGMLSSMIPGDVLGLLGPSQHHKVRGSEAAQSTCLTPPDSATISSSESLSFPCDLNEFTLDQLNADPCVENDVSHATGDLSTLLTPPPSLSPSSAPPELITVNVYWNDLPGLLIDGREYVRLVDIHKQIMPAKDTGILKKRCVMLSLEVSSCSELQRDFLIRYMSAAKSKSKVIVTKETALELIDFYVNPRMRTAVASSSDSKIASDSHERPNLKDSKVGPKFVPSANPPSCSTTEKPANQIFNRKADQGTPEQIKRSARLLNKRFSYLDMVNKGLPASRASKSSSKPDDLQEPVEDLQQKWLESLKKKFYQRADETSSDYDNDYDDRYVEGLSYREEDVSSHGEPMLDNVSREDAVEEEELCDESSQHFGPADASIIDYQNYFSPLSKINENLDVLSEESKHSQELSSDSSAVVCDEEFQSSIDVPETNIAMTECPEPFDVGTSSSEDCTKDSPRKSERVLRSSSSPETILSSKNDAPEEKQSTARTFTTFGSARRLKRQVDESSNENQSPRLIRNKRRFVRPLTSSNSYKRHILRVSYREGLSVRAQQGKMQSIVLQSRPHRQARRKFDTLKF